MLDFIIPLGVAIFYGLALGVITIIIPDTSRWD